MANYSRETQWSLSKVSPPAADNVCPLLLQLWAASLLLFGPKQQEICLPSESRGRLKYPLQTAQCSITHSLLLRYPSGLDGSTEYHFTCT